MKALSRTAQVYVICISLLGVVGLLWPPAEPLTDLWGELIGDDTLRMRQLPEEFEFDLFLEDQRVILELDPAEFGDAEEEEASFSVGENYAPHVLIFSSGDMTPFELHILRTADNQAVVLESDLLGDVKFADDEE